MAAVADASVRMTNAHVAAKIKRKFNKKMGKIEKEFNKKKGKKLKEFKKAVLTGVETGGRLLLLREMMEIDLQYTEDMEKLCKKMKKDCPPSFKGPIVIMDDGTIMYDGDSDS